MRALGLGLAVLALAGCAGGGGPRDGIDRLLARSSGKAQPSTIVATELAFARAAQDKGQWTAFREFAANDAVMFVPQPVAARDWLKQQSDPAETVRWQPHQVWLSCDGSLAVTKGAWQRPDGSQGYFTTVWKRQASGEYRWVLDQGDTLSEPLEKPDSIRAEVADCTVVMEEVLDGVNSNDPADTKFFAGISADESLEWAMAVGAKNDRIFSVHFWKGNEKKEILRSIVNGPTH